MSYRNAARRRQTKGVVLFTVVCILLFLFIMIMATLSVVSSAQTRTYTKFKENQAYFTARSALESVTTALSNYTYASTSTNPADINNGDNYSEKALYQQFFKMMYPKDTDTDSPKKGPQYINSNKNMTFKQMDESSDIAKIKVNFPQPPVGTFDDNQLKYLYGECTVYIQKTSEEEARFISHAVLGDSENTIVLYVKLKDQPIFGFYNALTTYGGAGADNMFIFGGNDINIFSGEPSTVTAKYTNSGSLIEGNQYYNCNVEMDNSTLYLKESGFVVEHDLKLKNNAYFISNLPDNKICVKGDLKTDGAKIGCKYNSTDTEGEPIDVFCNSLNSKEDGSSDSFKINGNLYVFGDDPVKLKGKITGNVYCLGSGDVEINSANFEVGGDLIVKGDQLTIGGIVGGNIYHTGSGNLNISNNLTVTGKMYTNATITGSSTFNSKNVYEGGSFKLVSGTDYFTVGSLPDIPYSTMDDVTDELPTLASIQAQHAPLDGVGVGYNAWGYYKDGDDFVPYVDTDVSKYKENNNWIEWPGFDNLPDDSAFPGYKVIDATDNNVIYHVDKKYSEFIPMEKKLLIKGKKSVSFYFDKGDYYFKKASITNESIYKENNIVLSTDGSSNNVELNTFMYFWGESKIEFSSGGSFINAYIMAPQSYFNIQTPGYPDTSTPYKNINYDGYDKIVKQSNADLNDMNLACMGSVVVKDISGGNAGRVFYVKPSEDTPSYKDPSKFWQDQYYFNR